MRCEAERWTISAPWAATFAGRAAVCGRAGSRRSISRFTALSCSRWSSANPVLAEWLQQWDPVRMQYEAFTDANPFMPALAAMPRRCATTGEPASADNPFIVAQEKVSEQIVNALDGWRESKEAFAERMFLAPTDRRRYRPPSALIRCGRSKPGKTPLHRELPRSGSRN